MEPQFQEIVDAINKTLDDRLGKSLDDRIDARLDARVPVIVKKELVESEHRVEERMKIHFENLEGLVKATADGYAMNLDRIERKVDELNAKFDTKFDDHDRILANHNERITTLENRP